MLGADSEKGTAAMKYEDTIEIRGVTVERQTDRGLLCRIGSQRRWIAPTMLQPGSTVAREGDVGIIVLERPFAVELDVVPFQGRSMREPLAMRLGMVGSLFAAPRENG